MNAVTISASKNFINFSHPARADFGNDAVVRIFLISFEFFIHLLSNSFGQIHKFQQILEARVAAEKVKIRLFVQFVQHNGIILNGWKAIGKTLLFEFGFRTGTQLPIHPTDDILKPRIGSQPLQLRFYRYPPHPRTLFPVTTL